MEEIIRRKKTREVKGEKEMRRGKEKREYERTILLAK